MNVVEKERVIQHSKETPPDQEEFPSPLGEFHGILLAGVLLTAAIFVIGWWFGYLL